MVMNINKSPAETEPSIITLNPPKYTTVPTVNADKTSKIAKKIELYQTVFSQPFLWRSFKADHYLAHLNFSDTRTIRSNAIFKIVFY